MTENTSKICRICLKELEEDAAFHQINDDDVTILLRSKLIDFVPDMDLEYTPDAIACGSCTDHVLRVFEFRRLCRRTEETVRNLRRHDVPFHRVLTDPVLDNFFYCHHCSYATDGKRDLVRHVTTHRKFQVHLCDMCDYSTQRSSAYKLHCMQHTGEKPFECSRCSYRTTHRYNLKSHLRSHTREKPFKCNECPYMTSFKPNLNQHLLKHSTKNPHQCHVCCYSTHILYNFKKHVERHEKNSWKKSKSKTKPKA